MFKAVCIDDSGCSMLKDGAVYDVAQSYYYVDCYSVPKAEYELNGTWFHYYKKRFIPLSEIDETEFERETLKQTVENYMP